MFIKLVILSEGEGSLTIAAVPAAQEPEMIRDSSLRSE
jgi:hypothetical protein